MAAWLAVGRDSAVVSRESALDPVLATASAAGRWDHLARRWVGVEHGA